MNGGKFFYIFEHLRVVQKSGFFFFNISFAIMLSLNLPMGWRPLLTYRLLGEWLFVSPTVCVHRAWIQVRTLPGSLLSFPDLSPLFSPEKETNKQTPRSCKASGISDYATCYYPSFH